MGGRRGVARRCEQGRPRVVVRRGVRGIIIDVVFPERCEALLVTVWCCRRYPSDDTRRLR
jgi:hypothetical protein